MKNAVIITPFDNYSYQVRIKYVENYLSERGYEVKVLSSDFDHRNKTVYSAKRNNLELLHVPPYQRNLSFARINSHRVFAKKSLTRVKELAPNLIYCSAPPNFLFQYFSQYKRNHPEVKLLFELGDLWPETLPLQKKIKKLASPVLKIWAGIRDRNIGYADGIIYECQMFSDVVSKANRHAKSDVIYLSKEDYYKGDFHIAEIPQTPLRFAYVGSINNIIDVDLIVDIVRRVNEKTSAELVVIGGGESADRLFQLCKEANVTFENHGIVYDEDKKHRILSSCHFGLNIMKDSVAVGATMKSLEYFHEGLVLINNIPADTEEIIKKYHCGFVVSRQKMDVDSIIDYNFEMRMHSRQVFEDLFDEKAIRNQFMRFLDKCDA